MEAFTHAAYKLKVATAGDSAHLKRHK